MDETGLSLAVWLQSLVGELRGANEDARCCAEQFATLSAALRLDGGWGDGRDALEGPSSAPKRPGAADGASPLVSLSPSASPTASAAVGGASGFAGIGAGGSSVAAAVADRLLMPPPVLTPSKRPRV